MTKYLLPQNDTGYPLDKYAFGDLSIVVPEDSTNLIQQPSFEQYYNSYYNVHSTITQSSAYQKFGTYSLKVATDNTATYYAVQLAVSLSLGSIYTFSVYIRAPYRSNIAIYVIRAEPTANPPFYTPFITVSKKYIGNGDWQRITFTFESSLLDSNHYLGLKVDKKTSTDCFYTDAWQLENKPYATTYFDGDSNVYFPESRIQKYYWNGIRGNSYSIRVPSTRTGGKQISLFDLGYITAVNNLGVKSTTIISDTLNDGTEYYQGTMTSKREFSITMSIYGKNYGELSARKKLLYDYLEAVKDINNEIPVLIYTKYDEFKQGGVEAVIRSIFVTGLEGSVDNEYDAKLSLVFMMPNPYLYEIGNSSIDLAYSQQLVTKRILRQKADYTFDTMIGGADNPVYKVIQTSDGKVWVCGTFAHIGGQDIKCLAYFDGTQFVKAGASYPWDGWTVPTISAMVWDYGNYIYFGCSIDDGGGNEYSLGRINLSTYAIDLYIKFTGAVPWVSDLAIFGNYLYIAGTFDDVGVAKTKGLAKFDLTAQTYSAVCGGIYTGYYINSLCFDKSGLLYITGRFTVLENNDGALVSVANFGILSVDRTIWNPTVGELKSGYGYVVRCDRYNNIYVGGTFLEVTYSYGGTDVLNTKALALWNGTSFSSVGIGLEASAGSYNPVATVLDIEFNPYGHMFVVGSFDTAGGRKIPYAVAVWNGSTWSPYILSSTDTVNITKVCQVINGDIYFLFSADDTFYASSSEIKDVDSMTYPVIQILGPGNLSIIVNRTNKRSILFNANFYIYDGEIITISFYPGGNSISSSSFRDMSGFILSGNTFFLSKGDNVINTYIYSGSTGSTLVKMWTIKTFQSLDGVG
jgi:hypothetical protein